MNAFTDTIFILVWFGALVFGIRLMSNGWNLMTIKKEDDRPDDDLNKMAEQSSHPELSDLKDGDEFLVVNFEQFKEPDLPIDKSRFKLDSPMLHDELNQSLKDRIKELEDNDDDDDGGAPVPAIR